MVVRVSRIDPMKLVRKHVKQFVNSRIFEEVAPFVAFLNNYRRLMRDAAERSKEDCGTGYEQYDSELLQKRLEEEYQRSKAIDEKTLKFTFVFSFGLAILGAGGGFLTQPNAHIAYRVPSAVLAALCVVYALIGGLLALGSLKTLPQYGYGTKCAHDCSQKPELVARLLAAQEKVNVARHVRNEAAYQCLRNSVILLMVLAVLVILQAANLLI